MTDKLKPCPFCGGSARIQRNGNYRVSMQIGCDNCGAFLESGDVVGLTDFNSYKWNQRHPDNQRRIAEMTAMMEEAITIFDRYLNVPESVALRKRWESFKNQTL
jgi:hypothetical protein